MSSESGPDRGAGPKAPNRDTHPGRLCADWLVVVEGGGIQHLREEGNQVAEDQMLPAASVSHIQ